MFYWSRFLLVVFVFLVGFIYFLPNFYTDYSAVVISGVDETLNEVDELRVKKSLADYSIPYEYFQWKNGRIEILFLQTSQQQKAFTTLKESLSEKYAVNVSLVSKNKTWLKAFDAQPMFLGLDLRGGVHFLIEVNTQDVLVGLIDNNLSKVNELLEQQNFKTVKVFSQSNEIVVETNENYTAVFSALSLFSNQLNGEFLIQKKSNNQIALTVKENYLKTAQNLAVEQNIDTLRNRVGELGVEQPVVKRQGFNRIIVELAGVSDIATAKNLLGSVAIIEFHMLNEDYSVKASPFVPFDTKIYKNSYGEPVALYRQVIVSGENVINAVSSFDQQTNSPVVSINLSNEAGNTMLQTTRKNLNKYMAVLYKETSFKNIIKNGKTIRKKLIKENVVSVARIKSAFSDRFQIEGVGNLEEAKRLAIFLRSGSLATSLNILQEKIIGPSLGEKNIKVGLYSVLLGFILVMIFMIVRYRWMGALANIALVFNLLLIIAFLSSLQATLTLPGIAGILLTVGISVDANVIIFERIKEQLASNLKVFSAINRGYKEALVTILDANVTTFIAALVLFFIGSGPVRGFSITLAIGIITSVFTAIFFTRFVLDTWLKVKNIKRLSI